MIFGNRDLTRRRLVSHYAKDIMQGPFYASLEQNLRWVRVVLISWLGFFASAFVTDLALQRGLFEAVQFGLSALIWGVFDRTVIREDGKLSHIRRSGSGTFERPCWHRKISLSPEVVLPTTTGIVLVLPINT
jgi:hypothetical protein